MRNCRGQGYDGAGNISGKYSGTAIRIQNEFPDAVYVHRASHRLNLCVANARSIQSIRNTFGTMKVVHDFFNWPKRLSLLEGKISAVYNQVSRHQLIDVCRTRWIARINALEVFESLYRAIILALEEVKDNKDSSWNRESCVDASGLFYQCISFEFIMSLVVARRGLSYVAPATTKLQAKRMEIVKAYSEIGSLKNVVMEKRRKIYETHRYWYEQAFNLAKSVGTSPSTPRICSNQTMRANPPSQSREEYYRITISSPFLDHLISQLDLRFSPDKIEIMKKGFLLVPFYMTEIIQASDDIELWKKGVSVFVERYEDDLTLFRNTDTELDIWHTYWSSKSPKSLPKTLSETLEVIYPMQTTFPTIYVLLQILATIPITSALVKGVFHDCVFLNK